MCGKSQKDFFTSEKVNKHSNKYRITAGQNVEGNKRQVRLNINHMNSGKLNWSYYEVKLGYTVH